MTIPTQKKPGSIALLAVGHSAYWTQFAGLLEQLLSYHAEVRKLFEAEGVAVTDYGMVDSSQKGYATALAIQKQMPDLIVCDMVTYATSSVFTPILQGCSAPILLVALQPLAGLDYTLASTRMQLENDNICSVPEFAHVAIRMGKPVEDVIIGRLYGDTSALSEIKKWCGIARVLGSLRGARIGLMGHVLEAMYDMHADVTATASAFGIHVPLLEIEDLVEQYEKVTEEEIAEKSARILAMFDCPTPQNDPVTRTLTDADLRQAAKSAVALDKLVEAMELTGLAYYYEGRENTIQREVATSLIVGNSLLNAAGIPMCGEYDLKTCIAMLLMDRFGIGGSFAELHPFDFSENFILVGHDGPHHIKIAQGRPLLRSLTKYHGKPGSGASVEFKIQEGPITMLGIAQDEQGKMRFILGEGISKQGPIPPTGNTNTRAFFEPDTKTFMKRWVMAGVTHHFALGVGHHAEAFAQLAKILGLEATIIR